MKGPKTVFVCRECGYTNAKWLGRCPECQCWNSFDEEQVQTEPANHASANATYARAEKISELEIPVYMRTGTGMAELDRVLGGGLVDSSVVLLSGEPGIGKSTLLL